jgi:uncharacterized protein (DUF362 family)
VDSLHTEFSRVRSPFTGWLLVLVALGACKAPHPERGPAPTPSSSTAPVPVVSAPSAHPDAISHASEVYAGTPVRVSGSVDGAALRKQHVARLKNDRHPVTVLKGDSALELGERICQAVVPTRPSWTPVLVKPNVCGFDGFKNPEKSGDDGVRGRVTDAEFVRGVVRCLKARGYTKITIAEGCGNSHAHWMKAIAVSGFESMAREEDVPLVAMDDDGVYDKVGDQPGKPLAIHGIEHTRVRRLLMPKILAETLERGLFISVPKLKAHRYSVVSLGIKGMQGTVMRSDASPAYNQKWRMHEELNHYLGERKQKQPEDRAEYVASLMAFAERMVDVLEISLPDVVLVDGAPASAGDGFQRIRSVPGKIAIGGTNPVLVDRVGSEYLGLWDNGALAAQLGGHRASPLIEVAARRYGVNWKSLILQGDGVELLKQSRPVFFQAIAPFTLEGDRTIVARPVEVSPAEASQASAASAPASSGVAPSQSPSTSALGPGEDATSKVASGGAVATSEVGGPVVRAAHVVRLPTIDGRIDSAWRLVAPVTWGTDYAGNDSGIVTRARFLWGDAGLFALFELSSADLNVDTTQPTSVERLRLYEEDCVELFFTPDRARPNQYYELELGPFGHWSDIAVDRERKQQRVGWSSQAEVATQHDAAARTAIIEARFSAPEIVNALRAGARLPVALYRIEGKGNRKFLAWRPPRTNKPNFHLPEGFGILLLDG